MFIGSLHAQQSNEAIACKHGTIQVRIRLQYSASLKDLQNPHTVVDEQRHL